MRALNFANRNLKEIIRDPLSIVFSVFLPAFLLFVFQQFDIPNEAYNIENFTPGIIIFSFSFITLFTATLVAKDRTTAFLTRLIVSPMKTLDFVFGYIISVFPLILFQVVIFILIGVILGLKLSLSLIFAAVASLPLSVLFIALGVIIGSFTTEKSASGISSIVVQLVCFTSGMYFPLEMLGNGFAFICRFLPFNACVNIIKGIMNSDFNILNDILIVAVYTAAVLTLAYNVFKKEAVRNR